MKNKVKITALILALIVSMASIVGCSNNSSTRAEASVSSDSSIEPSVESSIIEESSTLESSAEISSETTSTAESSIRNAHIVIKKKLNFKIQKFLIISIILQVVNIII